MSIADNENLIVQRTREGLVFRLPTANFTKHTFKTVVLFSLLVLAGFFYLRVQYFYLELRMLLSFSFSGVLTDILILILSLFAIERFLRTRLLSETVIVLEDGITSNLRPILQYLLRPGGVIYLTNEEAKQTTLQDGDLYVINQLGEQKIGSNLTTTERQWVFQQLINPENAELTRIARVDEETTKFNINTKLVDRIKTLTYPVGRLKGALERVYIYAFGVICFFKIAGTDYYEIERFFIIWNRIGFDALLRRGREIDAVVEGSIEIAAGLIVMSIIFYFARGQRMEKIEIDGEKISIATGAQPSGPIITEGRISKFIIGDFLKPKRKFSLSEKDVPTLVNGSNWISFNDNGKIRKFAVGLPMEERVRLIEKLKTL